MALAVRAYVSCCLHLLALFVTVDVAVAVLVFMNVSVAMVVTADVALP